MFAFTRARRLVKKTDYDYVFEKANKIVTEQYIVLYRKNKLSYARLGLAISKKMVAKSHDRNRIKRLLREGFRHAQLPAFDLVFLARMGIAKQTNSKISTSLSNTWEQLIACYDK